MTSKKPRKKTLKKQAKEKAAKKKQAKEKVSIGTRKVKEVKGTAEEIIKIEVPGKSIIVEEDLKRLERRSRMGKPPGKETERESGIFYKKFVFRCRKCMEEFEHTPHIAPIEHEISCPKCDEKHVLEITPMSGHYNVKFPGTIEIIGVKGKKKAK